MFTALLRAQKLPLPLTEHRFHPTRRWRFDYAWVEHRVALEVEGGVWIGGRHTTGAGFVKDMEKYNEAACMGWRIIRCQPKQLCKMETIDTIRRALQWQ
jgi:very-short-patch-repair endonuclease